jgi:hypothetical protein
MAISDAMRYRMNTGGSAEDLYATIRDFLAASPDAAATQAAMRQYGISGEDVANATGGASGGLLSGNIMAGASWNSSNTALQNQLTEATGQQTANYSVAGSTTTDTLNQLNTFLAGGGQFDPNATVYLQAGGVDFITGVDKAVVKDNLNQIVKTLGEQGVNVVLTGSPYAKSVEDVITNNFDPKVDKIYTDVAKANSNVALVGTQGEILQNKALLVDALHTNAEGTAVYNQSVIDALSQFKNEVPSSSPQAITQAYQTNTVATTPAVITQAAAIPEVAKSLVRAIPTARGTVIEGDDIEAKIAGVPQSVYETRVDPNNTANWETVNSKTGEVINSGTFAGGGDKGLLAAAAPVIGLAASTVGLPGLTGLLGGLTGTTGSTLAGLTGATIGGGTTAIAGGTGQDILKSALLGGGASYLTNALSNLDVPVDFKNMTAEEISDALQENLVKDVRQASYLGTKTNPSEFLTGQGGNASSYIQESVAASNLASSLAQSGLDGNQIAQLLDSAGFVPTAITDALDSLSSVANTGGLLSSPALTPSAGTLNVTGQAATTSLPTSLQSSITSPVTQAGTVNVTGAAQPQMVDQATLNLVANKLASNVSTPTNLANVQVTADKPASAQEITNAILATVPNTTVSQAQTQAQVLITSGQNLKTSDLVSAVAAVSPNITPTVAEQIITSSNSNAIQPVVSALVSTVTPTVSAVAPAVSSAAPAVSSNLANVQVTGDRLASTQEIANAVLATVPNITAQQAKTQAEVIVTSGQNLKVSDLVSAVASVSPNITSNIAEKIITSDRPVTTKDMAAIAAAVVPALATPSMGTQTITAPRPTNVGETLAALPTSLLSASVTGTTPPATTPASTSNPLLNAAGTAGLLSLLGGLGSSTANLISGGLGTTGNLLQMQTSREAAQRAQAMIDAETKAAKDAAQFRPIGMTTRFGTSQFGFDPVTGRLSSAGYNLTPDVKAQQDRFMALSNQGLTQAEQAQGQFAPLQTGAQRLFGLGNQYLAQSPQDVAQNYLNQQMALLQPGREQELATLQNRLQQQGRGGLSVAQGGTMGATTPELQALYNARATQEAQLAANAQQAGQRDVLFGAGLLGQGSQAMGQYYGGQQAAYAPYTTAMGQAQNLETLGQQPYNMGVNLGQLGAQTGFNVGQLGLKGAQISAGLATSDDATRNLLAQGLTAAGNPNAMFGQALGSAFNGLFGSTNEQLATNPYFQTYI